MKKYLFPLGLSATGVGLAAAGLTRRAAWGETRYILAALGGLLMLWALLIVFRPRLEPILHRLQAGLERLSATWQHSRVLNAWQAKASALSAAWSGSPVARGTLRLAAHLAQIPFVHYFVGSPLRQASLGSALLVALVGVIYVFYASVGQWTEWPATHDYYDQLADAFLHGRVALSIEPADELLALPDPYDYPSRAHLSHPWDVTLYNDKFYLYWGPVPGVLLAGVKLLFAIHVGDQYLVFFFLLGALLCGTGLILRLWRRFYAELAWPGVLLGVLALGLSTPMPWLLGRPGIYEAAIASGQFFLLAGLMCVFAAADRPFPSPALLFAGGLCWAAAVGSRTGLAFPLVLWVPLTIWVLLRQDATAAPTAWALLRRGFTRPVVIRLAALVAPLALGALGLAWYNQVRFGSIFEFGHRYQLTGMNLHAIYSQVFSPANIPANIVNYFFNACKGLSVFPYLKPEWGGHPIIYLPILFSKDYYTEQVVGLLPAVPFAWFAVIPLISLLRRRSAVDALYRWVELALLGGAVLAAASALLYIVATMRYLADFVPLTILASMLGFWQGWRSLAQRKALRRAYLLLALACALASAVIGLLLAITGYDARFERLNPALFEQLTRLLTW